ncbi:9504_t:CDS:2 [Gigaspora margarita]|uniref:9504_t:CDS:1 n=1 Tax=Gigaspora margarita TaxID=4874 RepID=A0ABN7VEL3_GIGMA|nr:9504_t:CDS:2 [Gigaspora margarita]
MEDYEYFTHVYTSPELVNVSNSEQLNSILKISDLGSYPEAESFLSLLYFNKQGITEGNTALNLEYAKQFFKWIQQVAEKDM